jgi:excisionase family DNA binding protein
MSRERMAQVGNESKPVDPVGPGGSRLMTIEEVAAFLNCSKSYVWLLTKVGTLPAIRLGRAIRISPEAVRAFVARAAEEG